MVQKYTVFIFWNAKLFPMQLNQICVHPFERISTLAQVAVAKYILNAKLVSLLQLAHHSAEMHVEQITESQNTEMNAKFVVLSFALPPTLG